MTEADIKKLQADLKAAEAKANKAEAALSDAQKANEELKEAIDSGKKTGIVAPPVPGKVTLTLENADGDQVKKTYKFRPGRIRVALETGEQVPSHLLLKLANKGKLSDEELGEVPVFKSYTKEQAIARLTYLASIGASMLVETK